MMINKIKEKNILVWLMGLLVLVCCELFFFRNVLDVEVLISDRGDGRLCNIIAEHWFRFFSKGESITNLRMFYPAENTLGYSDMLFLHGVIHSLLRFCGLDMYLAYKYTLIIIHVFGTITLYYLLSKTLKLRIEWAVFGTMAFSFSSTYAYKIGHTQLVAISVLPLLLLLIIKFFENVDNRKKKNLYAYAAIVTFIILLYTAWYVAFYTALFALIFVIVYAVLLLYNGRNCFKELWNLLGRIKWDLVGYILVAIVTLIPFVAIYLPVLQSAGNRSYQGFISTIPEAIDIINVTEQNWLLGDLLEKLRLSERGLSGEVKEGFSIVLLCSFATCIFCLFIRIRRSLKDKEEVANDNLLMLSSVIAILISLLFTIRLSSNGISLWYVIYKVIPGAGSIRAVARFLFWLSFPMAFTIAYLGNQYTKNIKISKVYYACGMLILLELLFASNVRENGVTSSWTKSSEIAYMESISEIPEDCEVFYIKDSSKEHSNYYVYQLDAMEIALLNSLQTINGYSGQQPDNWAPIWNVNSGNYENAVLLWCEEKGISVIYAYDVATNTWEKPQDIYMRLFSPQEDIFPIGTKGLIDTNKGEFVWVEQEFGTVIQNEKISDTGLRIKLRTMLNDYLKQEPDIEPKISIYINGEYVQDIPVIQGNAEYIIPVNSSAAHVYEIKLLCNTYFNPKDLGYSGDNRDLSVGIYYIGD